MKKLFTLLFSFFTLTVVFSQKETNNTCGTCDVKPGDIEKFREALEESKVHFYTDEGTTKLDLKKAHEECNLDYFAICNNKLVLTSTGQKKDRTEIRQKKELSLNDFSEMYYEASIFNTPKSNHKKGVTIAQIHNSADGVKRPLLRVEIAGGKEIRSVLTNTYIKGEGKVKNDLLVPFKDGDEIQCTVTIRRGGNKVSVYVFNKTMEKGKRISYEVSDLWLEKDGEFYFKAGAYTQVSGPKTLVMYDQFEYRY